MIESLLPPTSNTGTRHGPHGSADDPGQPRRGERGEGSEDQLSAGQRGGTQGDRDALAEAITRHKDQALGQLWELVGELSALGTELAVDLPAQYADAPGTPVDAEVVAVPFRPSVNPNTRERLKEATVRSRGAVGCSSLAVRPGCWSWPGTGQEGTRCESGTAPQR